jgi:hypothetical protein
VLEHPIRLRQLLPSARHLTIALGSAVVVVGMLAVMVDVPLPGKPDDIPVVIAASTNPPNPSTPDSSASGTTTPEPTVVALFGDSVPAWLVRDGAKGFDRTDVVLVNGAREACDAMIDLPLARDRVGTELRPPADCRSWDTWYPTVLDDLAAGAGHPVTVAALVLGMAPIYDHLVDGQWVGPCESVTWYLNDVAQRIDYLRGRGLDVVFVLPSHLGERSIFTVPDDHPARMECIRTALKDFLAVQQVPFVDLEQKLCPDGACDTYRSRDGMHVDPDHAPEVLDWLVEQIMQTRPVS